MVYGTSRPKEIYEHYFSDPVHTRQSSFIYVSVLRDYDTPSPAIPHSLGYVAGYP
jgi:hypothetical protein